MKIIKKALLYSVISFVIVIIFGIIHNNMGANTTSPTQIQSAFDRSVSWLTDNKSAIFEERNSMLWWMLIEADKESNNPQLKQLIREFKNRNRNVYSQSPWTYLIYGYNSRFRGDQIATSSFPPYNKYFIYSYSCNSDLASEPIIQAQHSTSFCLTKQPISPACITHQMMGYRFQQRTQCGDQQLLEEKINTLADYISYQLTFDFRVVDVYLQRVLMLQDSNQNKLIKSRWINRILAAQLEDGGWSAFQPLIAVGNNNYISFTSKGIGIEPLQSNFHATAQGVLLTALLIKDENSG